MNLLVIICIILLLLVLILSISFYDTHHFVVRKYQIKSAKLKKKIRICHLSDMHGVIYGKDNSRLMDEIDRLKPDIIISSGDVISAGNPVKTWENERVFFENLAQKYPVYMAIGNHEYRTKKMIGDYGDFYKKFSDEIRSMGICLLENESTFLEEFGIRIFGIEIAHYFFGHFFKHPMEDEYMERMIGSSDTELFNILIAHNPMYFEEYSKWGADLTMSGHVHGGIMRLPFLGGVLSPALILFPKYDGGEFSIEEKSMILSRGLGTHTINVRIFNPGELVITDLEPKAI